MSKQPPPAPIASAIGPCPTIIQISRTPQHWKFTQHLRTTRPPPSLLCLPLFGRRPDIDGFWLVGCFGFHGPFRQYFSLYRAVSQREGERRGRIDESKNIQTTPTRTYCKRNRPLPYCNQNCRTPRHYKFAPPDHPGYRRNYCLKGPLNPEQPPNIHLNLQCMYRVELHLLLHSASCSYTACDRAKYERTSGKSLYR